MATEKNEKLASLYKKELSKIISIRERFANENLGGPLLMDLDLYFLQPRKLFVVGQQTFGWTNHYRDTELQLLTYREFNLGKSYHSSPFWNVLRKLEQLASIEPFTSAWSNINRFDQNDGEPQGEILESITDLDYLIKEEITIIEPDICIFFTNRKYDYRLEKIYPGLQFEDFESLPKSHFCKVFHSDLPSITIRAPHPRTIRCQKWEDHFLEQMKNLLTSESTGRQLRIETHKTH